jgi:ribonuclease-3
VAARRTSDPTKALEAKARRAAEELAPRLEHRFANPALLARALTHPSADGAPTRNNQRLEFLGDRVLGLVIADLVYRRYPGEPEGALALRLSTLVRGETLAAAARRLGFGRALVLGPSEDEPGGRDKTASLANAFEAVVAALYLDGGLAAAARFLEAALEPLLDAAAPPAKDAKTALQEWAQGHGRARPTYRTVASGGTPHAPRFEIEVAVEGAAPVVASGGSKREAEHEAARLLLAALAGGPGHD